MQTQTITYPIRNDNQTVTYPIGDQYYRTVAKLFNKMCSYIGLDPTFYNEDRLYDCCKRADGVSFRIGLTMFLMPLPTQQARIYKQTGPYSNGEPSYIEVVHD